MIDLNLGEGMVLVDDAPSTVDRGARMHTIVETMFNRVGPVLVANGWSVFPQQVMGRRGPALISGAALKWKPYQDRLPTEREILSWAAQCPSHNAAIVTGAASSNLFALDLDIEDVDLAQTVREVAFEHLGETPYMRFGRAPRVVLLYRHGPEDKLRKRTYRFGVHDAQGAWVASGDMIEVLANGSPFTAYGHHHKTGDYFKWGGLQPLYAGPDRAPLVYPDQIESFVAAVQDVRGFHSKPRTLQIDDGGGFVDIDGMKSPVLRSGPDVDWEEDDDGKVVNGREAFLYRLVRQAIWANKEIARDDSGAGLRRLQGLVADAFRSRAVLDGRWDEAFLRAEVEEKTTREQRNFIEKDNARGVSAGLPAPVEEVQPPVRAEVKGDDSLAFLPKTGSSEGDGRDALKIFNVAIPTADVVKSRELSPDRTEIAERVGREVVGALDAFFGEVYAGTLTGAGNVHVLRAPTGAGKTTRTLRYIAEDPRTHRHDDDGADDDEGGGKRGVGPILFLMPTYNNIAELRSRADALNLDAGLDDEGLRIQARSFGLVPADEFDVSVDHLRRDAINAGLRVMVYQGKLRAGCRVVEKMEMLMEAGIGSSGLCKAKKKTKDGETEVTLCQHYVGCPAIEQRKEIARSHVVFMAHAFFTLKIPDELQGARCVIADERVFHLFVHTAQMHRTTLKLSRNEPRLTKKEIEEGVHPDHLIDDRAEAADKAAAALQNGRCPAKELFNLRISRDGVTRTGLDLVKSAKRVCGNSLTTGTEVHPDMSVESLRDLCNRPTGTEVREEWRFWQIVEERIEALQKDALNVALVAEATRHRERIAAEAATLGEAYAPPALPDFARCARGDREYRIQFLKETVEEGGVLEKIRLSWRSAPNWVGLPLLLLDASSPPEVIRKIFGQRQVVTHDIEAPLNVRTVAVVDRTYSNAAIVAGAGYDSKERILAGRLKASVRNVISAISGLYGWGRVVCGGSIVVRRAINTAWGQPTNVDWCHFGAMRGLDFAKNHAAAISVGRMEVPIPVIDGLVAALTYDDHEPETPYDVNGDQKESKDKNAGPLKLPLATQVVKMRSGEDVGINVPCFPGTWARIVQRQYREEELSQFLGRLRPVYRSGEAPVWFALSKVLPEHVIVDEVVSLDDLVMKLVSRRHTRVKLWDGVRATGGIVHPALLAAANVHLYRSERDAAAEIRRHGLCPETGVAGMHLRESWGFTPGRVRAPDGSWSWLYVRTDIAHPIDVAREAFARILGLRLGEGDIVIGTPVRPAVASGIREPDKVDVDIGSPEERATQEYVGLTDAAVWAFNNFEKESFTFAGKASPVSPVAISTRNHPDLHGLSITTFDIAGAASTDDMWHRIKLGHDLRAQAKLAGPGAEYDNFGARSGDEDEG